MKDYRDCPYWEENRCSGFNCCLEEDCKHSGKYQPWLKNRIKLDTAQSKETTTEGGGASESLGKQL